VEAALERGDSVQVDFAGILVTQSFTDELIGPLILRIGPEFLERVSFAGCSEDVKSVLRMVISGRLADFECLQRGKPLQEADLHLESAG
jgi:hypothetical protein